MDFLLFNCNAGKETKPFEHFWEHTVGSGHAALTVRADWQQQMKRCSEELGFKHVRFHDILSDEFSTVVKKDKNIYSFFNADLICDFLLSINMKPFIELSFMPYALASGSDTVFKYAANVTPPKNYDDWQTLIHNLVMHWIHRYGLEEVSKWFFEVWNEPNLNSFWKGAMEEYFKLYKVTATTIKSIHKNLKVGGPATAKNEWITEFIDFCNKNGAPFDFITTHHYPTDAFGKEGDNTIEQLAQSRRSILREQALKVRQQAGNTPVYYTEWSSSSNAFDVLHDQPYCACFIVKTIMEAQGIVQGYSYWTFSDIFSENYFSTVPFHGGFGLLNVYDIAKPAYRAFQLLHQLGNEQLTAEGQHETVDVWVIKSENKIQIVATNWALPKHTIKEETVRIQLNGFKLKAKGTIQRIDEHHANAFKTWADKGMPDTLLPDEVSELDKASAMETANIDLIAEESATYIQAVIPPQGLICITLETMDSANHPLPAMDEDDEKMVDKLAKETFDFFLKETNEETGLIADSTKGDGQASIAAVGLGISCYVAAVELGFMDRKDAVRKINIVLQFLSKAPQGTETDASGYKGFFYHFLNLKTGKRMNNCELSTIDSAMLFAGALCAQNYFTENNKEEQQLRKAAGELYANADWQWVLNGEDTISHGWTPESGFLDLRWNSKLSEAHILYILAMGSPSYPVDAKGYRQWTRTFEWKNIYGIEYFYAGPLFIHQLSQSWLDFKGIYDETNRRVGIDYFENSRRATLVQQQYAIRNPLGFKEYGAYTWGFTASDGPGPCIKIIDGVQHEFFSYLARGVPFGPDDGTLSPWVAASSLPFEPELVLKTIKHSIDDLLLKKYGSYGFDASFNPTFPGKTVHRNGWVAPHKYSLNQGPVILMIANYKKHLIWNIMKRSPYIIKGLRGAGFSGGWLDEIS